ncbi:hypothetical protein U1Q18_018524 [Sarracenia purpurea var. burkii]
MDPHSIEDDAESEEEVPDSEENEEEDEEDLNEGERDNIEITETHHSDRLIQVRSVNSIIERALYDDINAAVGLNPTCMGEGMR